MASRYESKFLHPPVYGSPRVRLGSSQPENHDLLEVAERLIAAFGAASPRHIADEQSLWSILEGSNHASLIEILRRRDAITLDKYFQNIFKESVLFGIDQSRDQASFVRADEGPGEPYATHFTDGIVRLAEAFGLLPVENPEQGRWGENLYIDPDLLLDNIQQFLGVDLRPPEIAEGRLGVATKHGLFAFRDISAIYTAYRLKRILADYGGTSVCEIGGGLGKVAYYAHLMGITDYTIIDLPQVNALQAFYLMRALTGDSVVLFGEPEHGESVKLYPDWRFAELPDRHFDLILNQDSMPELGYATSTSYLKLIKNKSRRLFLSINQESENVMTAQGDKQEAVFRLVQRVGGYKSVYRFPFWLRNGYTEELYDVL
jgi:hypothetical protein